MQESYNIGANKCARCKREYLIEYDEPHHYNWCGSCLKDLHKISAKRINEAFREIRKRVYPNTKNTDNSHSN